MADSPGSSDLSDLDTDGEDQLSTAVPSSRPSADITNADAEQLARPSKRRKTGRSSLAFDRASSSQLADDDDDVISVSSDGYSTAPGSPSHGEYAIRDEAQTECMWKDCTFGNAIHNDELVQHVQLTHCATGGPKKTKYVCEWGECQRKTSNHPSGYALKAHMRSHTKEKPYYCALPECDKSFTRSDALAKHMRTVHEPEPNKTNAAETSTPGKKGAKLKLTNGAAKGASTRADSSTPKDDGKEPDPESSNDNITYIPAHHPVTGQPGFMIHYPPDIHFTLQESSILATTLAKMLRRQLEWATKEGEELKVELEELEKLRKEEWTLKEILLEGVMETELAAAEYEDILRDVEDDVKEAMERDVKPSKNLAWSGKKPVKRRPKKARAPAAAPVEPEEPEDTIMDDASDNDNDDDDDEDGADDRDGPAEEGGFDGEGDPYDNYLEEQMAWFERRQAARRKELEDKKKADEAEAVGALIGMGDT